MQKQVEDCERPACDDTVTAMNAAMSRLKVGQAGAAPNAAVECPPNSPELGKSSWNLLHSMAAWYPDSPSTEDQTLMVNFFSGIARFYPCTWCAADFTEKIKEKPVQAKSREDLCIWLCEQHNQVNTKLGKQMFKCDMKKLDERWRKSSNEKCQSGH